MKLIAFDKSKNVKYFGECQLQIDRLEKCLNLKLLDKDTEETMTAKYDRNYVCKSNLFCCMDKDSKKAFVLVFPTKGKCEQLINTVLRVTSLEPQTSDDVAINEEKMFKVDFYVPLIKAVRSGINEHQKLKALILSFINSLEIDERLCYLNILANITLVPAAADPSTSTPATNLSSSGIARSRKRFVKNVKQEEDETPLKNLKLSYPTETSSINPSLSLFDQQPSPQNSSDVNFDIVEYSHNGKLDRKLLVFTSNDQQQCYEFLFNRIKCCYRCIKCLDQKKHTDIKATIHDDGSKTFDFSGEEHVCEPYYYVPESYESSLIIKSPNYLYTKRLNNGKMFRVLIIFADEEKNMCYQFGFDSFEKHFTCHRCKTRKRTVMARFIQHNGETSIELNSLQHICEPQKYIPDTL
jgi:hypothetical protein